MTDPDRPKDGVMCNYTALTQSPQPDILAENAALKAILRRCADDTANAAVIASAALGDMGNG